MSEPKPNIDYCHMINEQAKKLTTLRDEISKLKAELVKERDFVNDVASLREDQLQIFPLTALNHLHEKARQRQKERDQSILNQRGEDE